MDILKKMFEGTNNNNNNKPKNDEQPKLIPDFADEFRKPIWFDDCETDDELFDNKNVFGFQVFSNPLEMQKHFEQQLRETLKALDQFDGLESIDENLRENYMKPGFEEIVENADQFKSILDSDLDGEIYADQLHSFLQRISPTSENELIPKFDGIMQTNHPTLSSSKSGKSKNKFNNGAGGGNLTVKLKDEEIIWNCLHGVEQQQSQQQYPKDSVVNKRGGGGGGGKKQLIIPSRNGIFEGAMQGPKVFRQSIITSSVAKPDGSYETRRIVRNGDGCTETTITKTTRDGKSEIITTKKMDNDGDGGNNSSNMKTIIIGDGDVGGGGGGNANSTAANGKMINNSDHINRFMLNENGTMFLTKDGYVMPKNIW